MTQQKMTVEQLASFLPPEARYAINDKDLDGPTETGVWWFQTRPDLNSPNRMDRAGWLSGIILDADGLVEIRPKVLWRAEMGGQYWFVDDDGIVECDTEGGHTCDDNRHACGNYWRTEAQVRACADDCMALRMQMHEAEADEAE